MHLKTWTVRGKTCGARWSFPHVVLTRTGSRSPAVFQGQGLLLLREATLRGPQPRISPTFTFAVPSAAIRQLSFADSLAFPFPLFSAQCHSKLHVFRYGNLTRVLSVGDWIITGKSFGIVSGWDGKTRGKWNSSSSSEVGSNRTHARFSFD